MKLTDVGPWLPRPKKNETSFALDQWRLACKLWGSSFTLFTEYIYIYIYICVCVSVCVSGFCILGLEEFLVDGFLFQRRVPRFGRCAVCACFRLLVWSQEKMFHIMC